MRSRIPLSYVLCALATALAVLGAAAAAVLLNKANGWAGVLSSRSFALLGVVVLGTLLAAATLYWIAFTLARALSPRRFWAPLMTALLAFGALAAALELFLRYNAVPTALGERIGSTELLPHDWDQARRSGQQWIELTRSPQAVLDGEDELLGWDIVANGRSENGLYITSAEGLRGAQQGESLLSKPNTGRVALIGDSFTFGEEVAYEETWGHYLERSLPPGTQVLNFGVPTHGVDQTLLKFRRDVLPWKPRVTVFSFLSASPQRTTSVYLFLRPALERMFSKPRFVLEQDRLELLNAPVLSPDRLLASQSVWELPYLQYDSEFHSVHWEPRFGQGSYIARWLYSRFPRWPAPEERYADAAVAALASRLVEQLTLEIRNSGSEPLVVSLPVLSDLSGGPTRLRDALIADLSRKNIAVVDVSECLLKSVSVSDAFISAEKRRIPQADPGPPHYSPLGNAAVAACLQPVIDPMLR